MTQSRLSFSLSIATLTLASACGSVESVDNRGEPVVTVVARLDVAPAMMPESELRATLVWLNGPPFGGARCQEDQCEPSGRQYTLLTTADVAVEKQFPLTVRLGMFELPNPISGEYEGTVQTAAGQLHLFYNSLPEAEVVLYEDGNANGKLDFVKPGEAGPGPDRIVALSSGIDEQGLAVRTVVVNKRSPIPAGFANDPNMPVAELFGLPLPKELMDLWGGAVQEHPEEALFLPPGRTAPPVYADGVYALRLSAPATQDVVQQYLLNAHNLVSEPDTNDGWLGWLADKKVEAIDGTVVRLFPVGTERKSWLARSCNPYSEHTNKLLSPPAGAEIQCGGGALRYTLNPGDYCGWTRVIDSIYYDAPASSWWPCDAQGLKPGQPYKAAATALQEDMRDSRSSIAQYADEIELDCSTGRVYHYDARPGMRMPTAAPPAGSQVMCYGSDSLSYMPARSDSCRIKYTYDLSSGLGVAPEHRWDMRAARPAWWPCDAQGQLRADSPYVAAVTTAASSCPPAEKVLSPWRALPVQAKVRCDSASEISYTPLWSDGCAPLRYATQHTNERGSWELETPDWWPCDAAGKFIADKGYLPL